ncbi:fungal-specific transcription factor domain-containing protein [Suillus clintonianus]|uniref:fungal-specific transcription factor domain-containing protein n=1 Tax=Suillus clintonianus TaxID=1904413 RepID=UPI001B85E40A|nr:fungal-specific transcription factor domain-containing protein [Suillus clintonianus]KAG2141099.1 fungal-specific transcription factor domain-containing protein [Suillus clintonianus]
MTRTTELKNGEQKERKKPGRVPTSCAECRRLKLRCDRKIPCETCVKRGCAAICPSGSLTAGKGNRLVLANTEELHSKIEVMSARIRELEEGLRQMQSEVSDLPHPLLSDSITAISSDSPESSSSSNFPEQQPQPSNQADADSVSKAFGTLAIGPRGSTVFTGANARPEYLMQPPLKQQPKAPFSETFPRLSKQILDAWLPGSDNVPFDNGLWKPVYSYLPPLSEAIRLSEIYLEWGKVLWNPLTRSELFDTILGNVYRANCYEAIPGPHDLSLLFSIFALAALFDFDKPSYAVEAQEYHILSHVAIHFHSPTMETSVHTLIALLHIVQYLELSDLDMDSSRSYLFMGLAVKLGYRIGVHLSSARWKLSDAVVQTRNTAFWQMFMLDTWISFYAGRPPNVSPDWVDTPYPNDDFAVVNNKGEKEMSGHMWSWQFSRLLHHVMVNAFGAKIPTYSTILELDRKIRDFPVPPHLQPCCDANEAPTEAATLVRVQRSMLLSTKESTLLNIHRRYFTQALEDQPKDLLKHKYGPSVMAMYRSAWRVIESHSHAVRKIPQAIERISLIWSHALSAAIVMCMIVNRAPQSSIAASSLCELDVVYEVFRKSAPTSKPAAVLLDSITKVWKKGHEVVDNPHYDDQSSLSRTELNRLGGGKTHLISQTSPPSSASSPSVHASPSEAESCGASQACSQYAWDAQAVGIDIHPRIMQDMRVFDKYEQSPFTAGGSFDSSESFFQAMSDVQFSGSSVYGAEIYSGQPQVLNTFHPAHPYSAPNGIQDTPVLDAAWQNFVEQLGF